MTAAIVPENPSPPQAVREGRRWRNPYALLPRLRWAVQGVFALFLIVAGAEFYGFYQQVLAGGPLTAHRPPLVEGFLPISALLGLKRLVLTGHWDEVHPAGLAILLAAIASSFVARKAFCAWVCPIGTLSRGLEWLGSVTLWRRLRREALVPNWLDRILCLLKYPVMGFFVWTVLLQMSLPSIEAFIHSPYNYSADAKMMLFFVDMSGTAAAVVLVLVLLSVVFKNAWCRWLCPYGALLGFASWLSPQRVVRDPASCIDCRACTRACPAEIRVHARATVLSPECTGCMSCVAACPVKNTLTIGRRAQRGWSPWLVPAGAIGAVLLIWAIARVTGNWETGLPLQALMRAYLGRAPGS
jgi:polyferredoxin